VVDTDIDDVLVVERGERGLELHVHGAPAVLAALRSRFGLSQRQSCSAAERLLRSAMADQQLELALEQLACGFAANLERLANVPTLAKAEAVAAARARSVHALAQVQPCRVVLVGRQNAGKSSLFNRLLARERVLTGPLPGLTRDPVAEVTTLEGYPYELFDTAGEGEVASAVDAEALQAGRGLRNGALLVHVVDASAAWDELDTALAARSHLVIANKCDLGQPHWPPGQRCDAHVTAIRDSQAGLRLVFGRLLRACRGLPPAGPVGGFAALDAAEAAQLDKFT
jgi:small GTP-binding protein